MARLCSLSHVRTLLSLAAIVVFVGCVTESDSTAVDEGAPREETHPAVTAPLPRIDEKPERSPRYPRLLDDPRYAGRIGAIAATVPPRPKSDPEIEALLDSLTLRQRIGQRFIARVQGDRVTDGTGRAIVDVAPAGFIIYPWNFRTADDVRALTDSLQFVASHVTPGISLLLAADQEGGRVVTFRFPEFVRLPSAASIGRFGDPSLVRSTAYVTARQLADLGINMNFAPVLDVYGVANDSIIGDRSFGPDARTVAGFVRPYLEASRAAGVIATAKHFPGHGLTTIDTHHELPVLDVTRDELFAADLLPFREAINAEVPAIMTGHLLFERIDPFYPVTLSRVFLHDVLRRELGFEGVVVSDGLEMGAIADHYSLPDTLVRLFTFDVDLILLYRDYDVVTVVRMVEELIEAGELTEDDVNRGVRRVLALKRSYGLIDAGVR
jgi:beta-N-acetylhexosaminidase